MMAAKGKPRSDDADEAVSPAEAEPESPSDDAATPATPPAAEPAATTVADVPATPTPETASAVAVTDAAGATTPRSDLEAETAAAPPTPPQPPRVYANPSQPSGMERRGAGARVPGWLMPVYFLVPILAIALAVAFVNISEESEGAAVAGPDGADVYAANCAACHGPDGTGGVGPALDKMETVFPDFDEAVAWVTDVAAETTGPYGAGGAGNDGKGSKAMMPAFEGQLSPEEIRAVVIHEMVSFSGADPAQFESETGLGTDTGEDGSVGSSTDDKGISETDRDTDSNKQPVPDPNRESGSSN